jgi:cytochrome P450
MTPLFTRRESLRHADQVSRTGMRVCERLRDGQEVDLLAEMREAALNVIFQALFGVEVGERSRDIFGAIDELEETFDNPLFLLWPHLFEHMPIGRAKRFRAARATLRAVLGDLVRKSTSAPSASTGLVPRMVGSTGSAGTAHDDGVLLDHVLTFLLAGHDTTANTLTWAWHLLGKHPKIEAMLQAEWAARLGGRRPNADDMAELRLTDMVIKETLRLYPQAWIQGRRSGASFSWSSYEFPAGTEVMVSAFVTHRDHRFFANPDDFDPLRWDGLDDRKTTDFAYFPFGSGIHRCIGEFIAKMESVLLLATIGQNWAFWPTSASSSVAMRPTVTLKPLAGLRMIAYQRHRAERAA